MIEVESEEVKKWKHKKKEETKLKKILRDCGIKQTFVADKMGVNVRKINDYVNGRTSLKLDVAIQIANVLNIDVKELV